MNISVCQATSIERMTTMNLFDLSGKTAVIIGGNSTLGGSMALSLGWTWRKSSHRWA